MCLHRRSFRWSCKGVEAKHVASPNPACPGLLQKPLDAAIRRLLAPYRAMETINKTTMQNEPSLLAFLMAIAMRWYYTAHIAGWWRFVAFIKATKRHHRASTRSDITNRTCLSLILGVSSSLGNHQICSYAFATTARRTMRIRHQ